MLRMFDLCARAIFIALAGIIVFRVWVFFSPRPIDSYVHGGLIGAEQTETLFTGFATVPVLYFYANGDMQRFDPSAEEQSIPEKVNGFCYHLYDLAIGYANLAETVEMSLSPGAAPDLNLPEPAVLAANIVESRHGGALSRYQCDAADYAPTMQTRKARMQRFAEILRANQQWDPHRENAHAILLGLDQELRKLREELEQKLSSDENTLKSVLGGLSPISSAHAAEDSAAVHYTPSSGSLGSLKLTFATIALFTRDKNWFFQKNEFYVRQDNAEVTYGSEFYHDFTASRDFFGPRRITVTLPEPRVLAVNRFTLALRTHPEKFNPAPHRKGTSDAAGDEILQDPIERALTAELNRQMARVEDQAIMISKGLVADQIRSLMRARRADVEIRFERRRRESGQELIELLQNSSGG